MNEYLRGKKLAFVYNIRHNYPDPNDPRTFLEADGDDPGTIEAMTQHLTGLGYDVLGIEANGAAEERLKKYKDQIGLVFNYSEVISQGDRKQQITSVCERLEIPHTGSSDRTQLLVRNKALAKVMMRQHGIPVCDDQVFTRGDEPLKPSLQFPLIVKPVGQGSSAGITNKSVVRNERELRSQVGEILNNFGDQVLVEPFLTGREFSVGMLGNPPVILPIIEPKLEGLPEGYEAIDSFELKWVYQEQVKDSLYCPAHVDAPLQKTIEETVRKVWDALEIQDVCRIDTRCDMDGNLFVIEINSPAGLIPPEITESYLPYAASKMGMGYDQLLERIIDAAISRYKLV